MTDDSTPHTPTPEQWLTALNVLRAVLHTPALADAEPEFRTLVAGINRAGRKHARQRELLALPGVPAPELRRCYICKVPMNTVHPTNAALCSGCGELNVRKRSARSDLRGRIAILTGGRIKIGYETALKLLRDGARVIVTTRFPVDAAQRYAAEPDAQDWRERLSLYGLDLRDLRAVEQFTAHLRATESHLDILINNAAQTISRPPQFYSHLLAGERAAALSAGQPENTALRITKPSPLALLRDQDGELAHLTPFFPAGELDRDGQQLDLRPQNSWSARLEDVSTRELLEVQLVNATAPFLLCTGLLPLLRNSPHERRFVVNVSAMEGQFTRRSKTERHPHTNMAKAALNMLTRTSGPELAPEGIFMTSVDTGWITNEHPHPKAERMAGLGFVAPLDVLDGASRVYDPVVMGLTHPEPPFCGVFLKDYRPYPW